jgi:hypothetical protein
MGCVMRAAAGAVCAKDCSGNSEAKAKNRAIRKNRAGWVRMVLFT